MFEIFIPFLVLFWGLFLNFVFQYSTQSGEVQKLWLQEIVYKDSTNEGLETTNEKTKLTKEQKELFIKIDYLASNIDDLSDSIKISIIILCLVSVILIFTNSLSSFGTEVNTFNMNSSIGLTNSSVISTLVFDFFIFLVNLSMIVIILILMKINIFNPEKSDQIDMKLFEIWYNRRCFEHRQQYFKNELQPRILYEFLAKKLNSNQQTYDGRKIVISKELMEQLEKEDLISKELMEQLEKEDLTNYDLSS